MNTKVYIRKSMEMNQRAEKKWNGIRKPIYKWRVKSVIRVQMVVVEVYTNIQLLLSSTSIFCIFCFSFLFSSYFFVSFHLPLLNIIQTRLSKSLRTSCNMIFENSQRNQADIRGMTSKINIQILKQISSVTNAASYLPVVDPFVYAMAHWTID